MIVTESAVTEGGRFISMVENAHKVGLKVHLFTFRKDADRIPPYAENFTQLLKIFLVDANVDGIFIDFLDLAVCFLEDH